MCCFQIFPNAILDFQRAHHNHFMPYVIVDAVSHNVSYSAFILLSVDMSPMYILLQDPRSKFQQIVRKSSLSNAFRRTSQDSNCSDYVELPAVTISKPTDSPGGSVPSTPIGGPQRMRHSFTMGCTSANEPNNNSTPSDKTRLVTAFATSCSNVLFGTLVLVFLF